MTPGDPEFVRLNTRRHELIRRKHLGGGISADEDAELEDLQKRVGDAINAAFPPPNIDEILERFRAQHPS